MATFEKYGLRWPENTSALQIERTFIRSNGYITRGKDKYGRGLFHHYREMMTLCWPEDDHHRWSDLCLKSITDNEITVLMGSSDCVHGDTEIPDPATGKAITIRELAERGIAPTVQTVFGPERAGVPYLKGQDALIEVICENGARFVATPRHRVLTMRGFSFVASLQIGERLPSYGATLPGSTSAPALSVHAPDVLHSGQRLGDCEDDYPAYCRSCGEPLRQDIDSAQAFARLPVDAQTHKCRSGLDEDDQAHSGADSPPDLCSFLPSNCRYALPEIPSANPSRSHCGQGTFLHACPRCQRPAQFLLGLSYSEPFVKPALDVSRRQAEHNRAWPTAWDQQTRIASIKQVGFGDFYDLQVPKAHHYFAGGCIHHNSNKTYVISRYVLCDWWAHYENTLWMVSSTEMRGAELRIWGKLKELFNRARARHPWLPGTVLESKHAITTEEISEDGSEARLLTKGLIFIPCRTNGKWQGLGLYAGIKPTRNGRMGHAGDECFPAGTLVDTPKGPKPIEKIRLGDTVINATGTGTVVGITSRNARQLIKLSTKDGRTITCTPNHKFLTQTGWKPASALTPDDYILSPQETLFVLRNSLCKENQSNSVSKLFPRSTSKTVRGMQKVLHCGEPHEPILQQALPGRLSFQRSEIPGEDIHQGQSKKTFCNPQGALSKPPRRIQTIGVTYKKVSLREVVLPPDQCEDLRSLQNGQKEMRGLFKGFSTKEICASSTILRDLLFKEIQLAQANRSRGEAASSIPWGQMELQNPDRQMEWQHNPAGVQSRCCISETETGNRSRRSFACISRGKEKGREKDTILGGAWVDHIEILEHYDSVSPTGGPAGCKVYNFQVETHHSYSVQGLVVLNCSFMERSFLDAYSNWYGKNCFKGLLTGNPTDIEDPLCTAAEPLEGWDAWTDTGKTQEWQSKFYGAHVIALDGRDSPNMDYPADMPTRYPYMIGRKKLEAVKRTEGVDSPLWWMQCVGKPLPGVATLKVITRAMCEQFGAHDSVVWEGSDIKHVVGLDAAYGGVGGDRCVLFHIAFGKDVEGQNVLACYTPALVPVSVKNPEMAETQIAKFSMQYCDGLGVPPENFFFDARATLAVELARLWSPQVNAVDFGGPATKRPVSQDEYVWDGDTETKRLKRCDEHYSKFVTELWFSVRYALLGRQLRQLPKEVASEGSKRIWRFTKGQPPRIEVESKVDMKERTKQSPDLFDALVTAVEGARRLGFTIEHLKDPRAMEDQEATWLDDALDKQKRFLRKHELNYG